MDGENTSQQEQPESVPKVGSLLNKKFLFVLGVFFIALMAESVFLSHITNKPRLVMVSEVLQSEDGLNEEIDTSNWLTYRNEEFGFEIKYPRDWETYTIPSELDVADGVIAFETTNTERLIQSQLLGPGYRHNLHISYWSSISVAPEVVANNLDVRTIPEFFEKLYTATEVGQIVVGGNKAYEYIEGGFGSAYAVLVEKEGGVYSLVFERTEDQTKLTDTERIVLQSFVFVDSFDTLGWQTYRSEVYGYEFKYPSDWIISEGLNKAFDSSYYGKSHSSADGAHVSLVQPDSEAEYLEALRPTEGKTTSLDMIGWNGDYVEVRTVFHHPWDEFVENSHEDDGFGIQDVESKTINGIGAKQGMTVRRHEGRKDEIVTHFKYPEDIREQLDTIVHSASISVDYNGGDYEKEVYDIIVNSFEFFDPIDTSTWQIYRNEKFGFEFKYPTRFEVASEGNDATSEDPGSYRIAFNEPYQTRGSSWAFWIDIDRRDLESLLDQSVNYQYQVEELESGKVVVSLGEGVVPPDFDLPFSVARTQLINAHNGHRYLWRFRIPNSDLSQKHLIRYILETIRLF